MNNVEYVLMIFVFKKSGHVPSTYCNYYWYYLYNSCYISNIKKGQIKMELYDIMVNAHSWVVFVLVYVWCKQRFSNKIKEFCVVLGNNCKNLDLVVGMPVFTLQK